MRFESGVEIRLQALDAALRLPVTDFDKQSGKAAQTTVAAAELFEQFLIRKPAPEDRAGSERGGESAGSS